jgi:hypothetical protein
LFVVCVLVGLARPAAAQDERRIYIDFRGGASRLAGDSEVRRNDVPIAGETATLGVAYNFGTGGRFEFGGGYMITPVIGVGVAVAGESYESLPVVSARIPSPPFANTFATDSRVGDRVSGRTEGTFQPQVVINATPGRDLRVRAFGGPSFFMVEQDLVDRIEFAEDFPLTVPTSTVAITGSHLTRQDASGTGFHLGGDVSYFFKGTVGAGGYVSYWHGRARFADGGGTYDVTVGGVSYGGSLNFRF